MPNTILDAIIRANKGLKKSHQYKRFESLWYIQNGKVNETHDDLLEINSI